MKTLKLEIGGLSLTLGLRHISPFTESNYPRERIDGPGLKYSIRGNSAEEGTSYEPKHIWQVGVRLKPDDWDKLCLIYDCFLLTKPRPDVLVTDTITNIREPAPRTRGLAIGGSVAVLAEPIGWISYPATFNTRFTQPPKASEEGYWRRVSFQLQETGKTTP